MGTDPFPTDLEKNITQHPSALLAADRTHRTRGTYISTVPSACPQVPWCTVASFSKEGLGMSAPGAAGSPRAPSVCGLGDAWGGTGCPEHLGPPALRRVPPGAGRGFLSITVLQTRAVSAQPPCAAPNCHPLVPTHGAGPCPLHSSCSWALSQRRSTNQPKLWQAAVWDAELGPSLWALPHLLFLLRRLSLNPSPAARLQPTTINPPAIKHDLVFNNHTANHRDTKNCTAIPKPRAATGSN